MKPERSDSVHRPDRYVVQKPTNQRLDTVAATKAVTFRYTKPGAQQVIVVGTFNQWNPEANPMEHLVDGTHHTVIEIPRGHHEYHFLVDGVVMTEFGRRVYENASFGTDHGRGSVMFLMGGGIRGGRVLGKWPTLDAEVLEGPGDLPVTTNYRNALAPVLARHGAARALDSIFPGFPLQPVNLYS